MPAKNALKLYSENGYYHLYNRGVAKNPVYLDEQDYLIFMSYLKDYLTPQKPMPKNDLLTGKTFYLPKNYYQRINLLSFVLMPNHFHLLLKQQQSQTIEFFMRSLLTRYVKYFNKRYERVGHLFQGVYKGVLVEQDEYLWWLTRYIHRNPREILPSSQSLMKYPYSSYPAYLGKQKLSWVDSSDILAQVKHYQDFVESDGNNQKFPEVLSELSLES